MNERTNDDDDADGKKKPPVPVAGRHFSSRVLVHQDNCSRLSETRSPVLFFSPRRRSPLPRLSCNGDENEETD